MLGRRDAQAGQGARRTAQLTEGFGCLPICAWPDPQLSQPPEEPASSREAEWSPVLRSARSETQESSTMESLFLFALI